VEIQRIEDSAQVAALDATEHAADGQQDLTIVAPVNDPYGEHDFGIIECEGERVFWKIDTSESSLSCSRRNTERRTVVRHDESRAASYARLCCTLSQRQVALHQNTGDVAQVGDRVILLDRAHRKIPQDSRDTRQQIAKLNPRQAHQFSYRKHSHNFLHRYRPRQSRPCDGGQSDGGGGCIACDRNEEEECFALAAISRRTVRNGRKKAVSGAGIDGRRRVLASNVSCASTAADFGVMD
jgi:Protein of unknown function (DUF3768)